MLNLFHSRDQLLTLESDNLMSKVHPRTEGLKYLKIGIQLKQKLQTKPFMRGFFNPCPAELFQLYSGTGIANTISNCQ